MCGVGSQHESEDNPLSIARCSGRVVNLARLALKLLILLDHSVRRVYFVKDALLGAFWTFRLPEPLEGVIVETVHSVFILQSGPAYLSEIAVVQALHLVLKRG